MAEGGSASVSDKYTMDMQIMDCSEEEEDNYECVVPTQNRFKENNGLESGRGSEWTQVRRSKRKKVSSGSTENIGNIDPSTFGNLSNDDKLSSLFELAFKNFQILNDVRNEQTTFYKTSIELKSSIDSLRKQTEETKRTTEHQTNILKMLAYRSIDTEARSRRNNIIIWGVSENSHTRLDDLVLNFLEDEMLVDSTNLVIDRVHRVGSLSSPKNRGKSDPKRPIIIRFRDYIDTERVMRNAYKLKGTPFGIDRDYPHEIVAARKELYHSEEAKQAREKRAKIQIRYPAKLYVDGKLVKDSLPEWHEYLNKDRIASFDVPQLTNVKDNKKNKAKSQHNFHEYSTSSDDDDDYNDDGSDDDDDYNGNNSVFHRSTDIEPDDDENNCIQQPRHTHQPSVENDNKSVNSVNSNSVHMPVKNSIKKCNLPTSQRNKSKASQQQQNRTKTINPVRRDSKNTNSRKHTGTEPKQTPRVSCDKSPSNSQQAINRHGKNPNTRQHDNERNSHSQL